MTDELPTADDVLAAAARIAGHADLTPVLRSRTFDALAGCSLHLKAEHLQRGGAFKFRGACNAVWTLPADVAARGVVTHSSGNHGAALALAARSRGIPCHVVVPAGAVASWVVYRDTAELPSPVEGATSSTAATRASSAAFAIAAARSGSPSCAVMVMFTDSSGTVAVRLRKSAATPAETSA